MSETGGDFTENSMPHMQQKSRLKNTAPIRDVNALTEKNFLSGAASGNFVPSETTTNSLIANKNLMMAN